MVLQSEAFRAVCIAGVPFGSTDRIRCLSGLDNPGQQLEGGTMSGYMFGCPHCSAKLEARDETRAGRVISCPQCKQPLTIPSPPPMGVLLSAPAEKPAAPATEASPQIQVNADPGFKRGMSPAKAYDGAATPAPASSGFEKLAPSGDLDSTPQHTIEASDDVEAYSFTIPEAGEAVPPPRKKKKKFVEPEPEVPDVHPLEDPKYQLLILVVVVGLIVGGWKWYKSGEVNAKAEKERAIAEAKAKNEAPPPRPAAPGQLPGAATTPVEAATPTAPAPIVPPNNGSLPGQLPGATTVPTEPAASTAPAPVAPSTDGKLPGASAGPEPVPPATAPAPTDSP